MDGRVHRERSLGCNSLLAERVREHRIQCLWVGVLAAGAVEGVLLFTAMLVVLGTVASFARPRRVAWGRKDGHGDNSDGIGVCQHTLKQVRSLVYYEVQ
jgi:hypothetical protein